ncbi:PREDICTED: uncharacterized protein LOC109166029 [Ipomoea nil]|uniref:uncharacterized protein LOC109166029 n=1 Tax=Ipomoea nil TaxID=35883 RepID=UPI0009008C39|nr:PREDICTED: uncharacterized protein LOC109166029 [Ipomoea nil]
MENLTLKESKRILTMATHIIVDPWPVDSEISVRVNLEKEFLIDEDQFAAEIEAKSQKLCSLPEPRVPKLFMNVRDISIFSNVKSSLLCVDTNPLSTVVYTGPLPRFKNPMRDSSIVSQSRPPPASSGFSIRDLIPHSGEPLSPSQRSVLVDLVSNLPKPPSSTQSVPIVSVPFQKDPPKSRKGKAKIGSVSTLVFSKRKASEFEDDDLVILSEVRKHRSTPSGSVRLTRSKIGSPTPVIPPVPVSKPVSKSATKSTKKPSQKSKSTPASKASSSKQPKPKVFQPTLHLPELQDLWELNLSRSLLVEKVIDVDNMLSLCNIITLLRDQTLLDTVRGKDTYSMWLTPKFYTNLSSDSALASSPHYHQVYARGRWFDFSPVVINRYFNQTAFEEDFEPGLDVLASSLTHAAVTTWPSADLLSTLLTTIYSVLFRLVCSNWLPFVALHCVSKKMVVLLYKIRHKINFDLGSLIYNHIMGFTKGKEPKVHLPFSCLIYGILKEKGIQLYENEHEYAI